MGAVSVSRSPAVERSTARRAVGAALVAMYIDGIDINAPVFVLVPAQAFFLPHGAALASNAIFAGLTYGATLIGRPLGSMIFGVLADVIGRKRTTIASVTGFGVVTLLIACLPGYALIGPWAAALLLVLRFVDGVFLGGEYSAANPLAMEYCPREKRGLYGSIIQSAPALAQASLSLVTFLLLLVIPAGPVGSPYVQWGWRLPFVAGGLLAFGLALYYRRSIAESELWRSARAAGATAANPLAALFSRAELGNFLRVFVLMTGVWLAIFPVVGSLPTLLVTVVHIAPGQLTLTLAVATALAAAWYPLAGMISQRVGRRAYLVGIGIADATLGAAALALLLQPVSRSAGVILLLSIVVQVVLQGSGALNTVYICERFRTSIRGSGFGMGYSLAIVLPSLYALYQAALLHVMPLLLTIVLFPIAGGIIMVIGAALGPETKDLDMSANPAA